MDVLRPPIVCIEGRCYRKNQSDDTCTESWDEEQTGFASQPYDSVEGCYGGYQEYGDNNYSDEENANDIEETDKGFRIQLDIPSPFFKHIIGKKGETKKRLERETRTQIRIPRQGEEGAIVVTGQDRAGVSSARTRIEVLVESARQKQPFTHFVSLPMNVTEAQGKFEEFREDVLRSCSASSGVDISIFQNPDKLHLTLGVLTLMSEAEIDQAAQLLDSCVEDLLSSVVGREPLVAQLGELEYMNDDPGEVDVLYCKVRLQDGSDRLQILADRIVETFVSSGLMQRQYDRVKLHITLMNTLFRKDSTGTAAPTVPRDRSQGFKLRESFDARAVLKTFGDYQFGRHTLKTVHLSQRYSTACNGYYSAASKTELPS